MPGMTISPSPSMEKGVPLPLKTRGNSSLMGASKDFATVTCTAQELESYVKLASCPPLLERGMGLHHDRRAEDPEYVVDEET